MVLIEGTKSSSTSDGSVKRCTEVNINLQLMLLTSTSVIASKTTSDCVKETRLHDLQSMANS